MSDWGVPIIDFHVHVLPSGITTLVGEPVRKKIRNLIAPISESMHQAQTMMRLLPDVVRRGVDEFSAFAPLASLVVESTAKDLKETMDQSGVSRALLIAHPPVSSNEFIFEVCSTDERLMPVVNIPRKAPLPTKAFKNYVKKGAVALKIHPAADGEGVRSKRYRSLIAAAGESGKPVIIHTGCHHSHLLYRKPELGKAEHFVPWFEEFKDVDFVLAHMNFHEPHVAMDIAEEHPRVYVDTSWQPSETIGEAVRRLGAEKVLFGTDWPLVGGNMSLGLARIRDCLDVGTLNESQSKLILGGNAARLLGIKANAD